jgi:hypothetical protein
MKSLPSTLFFKSQPLKNGLDVALLFAVKNYSAINEHYSNLQKGLLAVNNQKEELENEKYWLYPAIACVAGLILGILVNIYLLALSIGGGIWLFINYRSNKDRLEKVIEARNKLIKELNAKMPQMIKKIGSVNYCAEIIPYGDGSIVSDLSEIIDNSSVKCTLINNCEEKLSRFMEIRSRLSNDFPVLLPPGLENDLPDKVFLTGIEKDVEDILIILNSILTDCSDANFDLPVFKKDDKIPIIIKDLENRFQNISNGLTSIITTRDRQKIIENLKMTNIEGEIVKSYGFNKMESLLRTVFNEISDLSISLTEHRDFSINEVLLKNIKEIEKIYDFPLTRFYNPKLSGSLLLENPIKNYNGIDFESIEPVQFEPFYKKNEMLKIKDMQSQVKGFLKSLSENDRASNSELNHYMEKKYENYSDLIKDLSLEISPEAEEENAKHYKNAILNYNTFRNRWICQLTNEEFSNEEALKSRILKVKEDLIIPIWDKLWLEKHDEKVRVIREKELELRENKKQENSELREEVKIFTEELRPIRNNLEKSAVDAKVGEQKLKLSINFYTSQDILGKDTINKMRSYLASDEIEVDTVFQTADTMEENLEKEPESVMLLRGELKDYTLQVRNKDKFFITKK